MTDVYIINIAMNQPNAMAQLQFTDVLLANAADAALNNALLGDPLAIVRVNDQYGISFAARPRDILCIAFIHKNRELDGAAELQILSAHANARLQKRAQRDPMLQQPGLAMPANGILRPQ